MTVTTTHLRVAAACAVLACSLCGCGAHGPGTFEPGFSDSGLVTNEYAYWHPRAPGVRTSPDWTMTSGSLFARDGAGWTGTPDGTAPGATSARGTDSAVFRLVSRRNGFGDSTVRLRLRLVDLVTTPRTPPNAFDGVHIWLRYHSERELYAVSVARRDGEVCIKRKTPNGPSNGGTYVTLSSAYAPFPEDRWTAVAVTVRNLPGDRTRITLDVAGRRLLDVVDAHPGRLVDTGHVGIRGDNAEFLFQGFTATTG